MTIFDKLCLAAIYLIWETCALLLAVPVVLRCFLRYAEVAVLSCLDVLHGFKKSALKLKHDQQE